VHFVSSWEAQAYPPITADGLSDANLVRLATGTEPATRASAFNTLYLRYAGRIYAYLRTRTHNAEDTADITQQVFMQALDALPRYQQAATPFVAWLFRIARNCAATFHRREHATVPWDALPIVCHPCEDDMAVREVMAQEDRAYLRSLLEPLPAETREMLVLRFAAGLSIAEIATVLGKGESAVKKRLARAMQTLKERSRAIAR
jgi:RNA polymerase sigma-70 factor (ECF subfamily)